MSLIQEALRGGHARPPAAPPQPSALVIGGAGTLGSAVLERLLAGRRFAHVRVLVTQGFHAAMHGLEPLVVAPSAIDTPPAAALAADIALVVFDRTRRANGREDAFVKPSRRRCRHWRAGCSPAACAGSWWCCRTAWRACRRP